MNGERTELNPLKTTESEKIMNTFLAEFNRTFKKLGIKEVNYYDDGFGFWYPAKGQSKEYRIKITYKR